MSGTWDLRVQNSWYWELVEHEDGVVAMEFRVSDGLTDTGTDSFISFLREYQLGNGFGEGVKVAVILCCCLVVGVVKIRVVVL